VTRVQDSSKDEMEDTTIEKSTTLPMAGQTIELGVTQDFLQRAHQWKFVRVILVLLPSTAQSDQISKLSDVLKVGGQIAVNNSFVMQSSQRNIYQGGHRPTTDDIVTQKGRNNIFQHGNNNQASINETTPTVQSAVLEVRWLCRVRPDAEMPLLSNRDFSMMRATAGLFSGSIPPVRLSVLSPIHQQQGSDGRLEVIETFAMPPQSGWIGKAIDSLPTISKVAADILGITFYDCSEPISGESITLSINGTGVWRTSRFSTLPATDGMFVVSADVDTWPSKDQLIKKLAP